MDINILSEDNQEIEIRDKDEDVVETAKELGLEIEGEKNEDELLKDKYIETPEEDIEEPEEDLDEFDFDDDEI